MAKGSNSEENELLAALGNPLRRQILRRMQDVDSISPRQLSEEFERSLSNIAYHVRILAECGAITLVGVEPVRGAVKHFYRSSLEQPWAQQIIELEPWSGPSGEIPGRPSA